MDCSESSLVEFLAGELPAEDVERVDAHLLTCEACWRAVQEDRAGRDALEFLRTPAPPGLADRLRLALEVESDVGEAKSRRGVRVRNRLVALALAVVVLAAGAGGALASLLGSSDPAPVATLATMAGEPSSAPSTPGQGEWMRLGSQRVFLRAYRVDGVATYVATSTQPFSMPAASHVVVGSSARAWMATRGLVGLYCINAPAGRRSLLIAAPMPAVELPGVLAHLKLN